MLFIYRGCRLHLYIFIFYSFKTMENLEPLILSGAAGAIAGFLIGYAIKKLAKIVAIFLGIILLVILFLASQGIIYINLKSLENKLRKDVSLKIKVDYLQNEISKELSDQSSGVEYIKVNESKTSI